MSVRVLADSQYFLLHRKLELTASVSRTDIPINKHYDKIQNNLDNRR